MGATVDFGLFWLYVLALVAIFGIILRVMFILDDEHRQAYKSPKLPKTDIRRLAYVRWH